MKVFFAVPHYREPHPKMAESLEQTILLFTEKGHTVLLGSHGGDCYIQNARNSLAKAFLDTDAETLCFFDDDVSWNPEDALRLAEMPDDVVAGVYRMKKAEDRYPVVVLTDENHIAITREDGCIKAAGVPGGFLFIKRRVLEALKDKYPELAFTSMSAAGEFMPGFHDFFPQGVKNGRWVGEDFAFCWMWRDAGGEIWVVPNLNLGHHRGEEVYEGNYHEFLMRQPGGSKA